MNFASCLSISCLSLFRFGVEVDNLSMAGLARLFQSLADPVAPSREPGHDSADGDVERPGNFLVAELPGVDKKNINISLNNDILTIKGEIKKEEKVNNEDYHYSERSFGSFARHLSLPAKVEDEKIKANFKDGILEIILPYSKKAKQKEINIEVK